MNRIRLTAAALLCATLAAPAWAQTTVQDAWVRGTVAAQKATGAFLRITSAQGGKLVGASSPIAGMAEIHEMKMADGVMKMGAVSGVELPAGQPVDLKPGGYHVMLLDLKQPVKAGDTVPLTLVVEGKDGKKENVEVKASVKALGAPQGSMSEHMHEHMPGMQH